MIIVDGKLLAAGSSTTRPTPRRTPTRTSADDGAGDVLLHAYFKMLYDNGWKPKAPTRPPEGTPEPEVFFGRERLQAMGWSSED